METGGQCCGGGRCEQDAAGQDYLSYATQSAGFLRDALAVGVPAVQNRVLHRQDQCETRL